MQKLYLKIFFFDFNLHLKSVIFRKVNFPPNESGQNALLIIIFLKAIFINLIKNSL